MPLFPRKTADDKTRPHRFWRSTVLVVLVACTLVIGKPAFAQPVTAPAPPASDGWRRATRLAPTGPAAPAASSAGSWQSVTSPTLDNLLSVAMVSASEGWAVSDYGDILHYTGGSWQTVASPTSNFLYSVAMVSASEGWAVGDYGTILHYTGGSWHSVASPTNGTLYSVAMVSASEGWAVGVGILHYTGGSWKTVVSETFHSLHSVAMVSASEGWAVGTINGAIMHYTGGSWQSVASPTANELYSVAMVSASEGWAVGWNGTILHYTGGSWQSVASPMAITLNSVAMVSASEGWAVGGPYFSPGGYRSILHYTGGSWQSVASQDAPALNCVAMVSASEGWAVGNNGAIMHYTGGGTALSPRVFLPLVLRSINKGIHGHVTYGGAPVASINLLLRFYDGSTYSTAATTTTAGDGSYAFMTAPALATGQSYYVRYHNAGDGNADNSSYLWSWASFDITSYAAGADVSGGDFDVANIVLQSPAPGSTVSLPQTFQWQRRSATPSDSYVLEFTNPPNVNLWWYSSPLGFTGSYTLSGLPSGFTTGTQYGWDLIVETPDGGSGLSYYYRPITFSGTAARTMTDSTANPAPMHHDALVHNKKADSVTPVAPRH